MNRTKITILQELFVTQMNFWSAFPVVLAALILSVGGSGAAKGLSIPLTVLFFLILSFLPLLYYWIRCRISGFFVFFLLHAGSVALLLGVPFSFGLVRICTIGLCAIFAINSFRIRLYADKWEDKNISPVLSVLISGCCVFILQYMGFERSRRLLIPLLIFVLSLYFLIFYIEKYRHFLAVNESSASHIPEEKIFRSGLKMVLGYTCAGAFFLLLTSDLSWFEPILNALKYLLVAILKLLFINARSEESQPLPEPEMPQLEDGGAGLLPLMGNEEKPFLLWDILLFVICFLIAAFLFYVLLRTIVQAIRYLHGRFTANLQDLTQDELSEELDFRERLRYERKKEKKERNFFGFLSINEKVRRLYRKQALRLDENVYRLRRITARECAESMQSPAMGHFYEKARYSGQNCTTEDLKQMKSACKKAVIKQ